MKKVPNIILTDKVITGFKSFTPEQVVSFLNVLESWNNDEIPLIQDALVKFLWDVVIVDYDKMADKYKSQCERNRQNGMKGGAPRKTTEPEITHNNPLGSIGVESTPQEASVTQKTIIGIGNRYIGNDIGIGNWPNGEIESELPPNAKTMGDFKAKTKTKPKPKNHISVLDVLEKVDPMDIGEKLDEYFCEMFDDFNENDEFFTDYLAQFRLLEFEEQIKAIDTYRGFIRYMTLEKKKDAKLAYYLKDRKWKYEWLMNYV